MTKRRYNKQMKKLLFITLLLLSFDLAKAQSQITLDECYTKARENYPLIKQKDYLAQSKDYNVSNVWKGYFPQITINGQATYQSDVTSIPIPSLGASYETLSKDQYKAYADVSQVVYDGGVMSSQADIQNSMSEIDDQKLEIDLLNLKERVNQIYFGILLLDEQLKQLEYVKKDLNESLAKLSASYEYGTATKTNVDLIKAEILNTEQRNIEMVASRKAYIDMLDLLINSKLDESTNFVRPSEPNILSQEEINRPELKLYSFQQTMIENQNSLTVSKILPKASLFFQGGYGKPTFNMLKNDFGWYYIAGARLSWSLSNLYTQGNEYEINDLNKKIIDTQKETFVLNTNVSLKQQLIDINKLKDLINIDKEIIEIRTSVKKATKSQLENGVVTSSDFIRDLNSEDSSRQNLAIHTIQLLLAQYEYNLTTGN
jgi:outer membrane protein TolC